MKKFLKLKAAYCWTHEFVDYWIKPDFITFYKRSENGLTQVFITHGSTYHSFYLEITPEKFEELLRKHEQ